METQGSLLSVDVMVGVYDTIERHPANFTPPNRTSLFYATRCSAGVAVADVMKIAEFWSECSRAKYLFSQISKPNELIFNTIACA